MALLEVKLVLGDRDELTREYERNLRHGRAFVPELVQAELLADVALVVERSDDGATMALPARVVMKLASGPMCGTALELDLARPGAAEALATFVASPSDPASDSDGVDAPDANAVLGREGPLARLRQLPATERHKLAREGTLEERVLLERLFGKALWEDLLRNPQISVPEVARIAGKGTAPRILLENIADNPAWSRQSIVRRALLANPRVSLDAVAKLLRHTERNELRLIVQTTAYPATVRAAARKLIDP